MEGAEVLPGKRVSVARSATLGELRVVLASVMGVPANELRVMYVPYHKQQPEPMNGDHHGLQDSFRL